MSFARPASKPAKHVLRVGFVILLHVALIWGLMNGLARKIVQIVEAPLDATIIEEVKPPPPPPPKIELPPKSEPPPLPPAFIPPPEVVVPPTPSPQPTITATQSEPVPMPAPSPTTTSQAEAPSPPKPQIASASVVCSNYSKVMGEAGFPREATRKGIEKGDALIQFTLGEGGEVKDVKTIRASNPIFASNSMRIVNEYKCAGQGREVIVQVPFAYKSE